MPEIKLAELLVVGLVVFFIFGPNKLSDLGGALGRSIRGFRTELKADDTGAAPAAPTVQQIATGEPARCIRCGGRLGVEDKFCANCGAAAEAASN